MIVTDGKIYDRCPYCSSLIRLNKPLIGSLHVCLLPEERAQVDAARAQQNQGMLPRGFLNSLMSAQQDEASRRQTEAARRGMETPR